MRFNFPSKLLTTPDNYNQKESLRKIGVEIKQSVPAIMDRNATYTLGEQSIGTKKIINKLKRKPNQILPNNGPGSAIYTVSQWDKEYIVLNITQAGKVQFTIST